ncbi:hypothetical protein FVE85_2722 [Porphyridium purpureum]|uniref:Uncharacterized protein n=1 Tax=Porphyridium purpureum TaxID=35688 RepID=A0A5J4YSK8_PORPP|nr:hypothetical protein FVE85_2722 [Porphyridium purpureum]|eukprot:POR1452..scf227_4
MHFIFSRYNTMHGSDLAYAQKLQVQYAGSGHLRTPELGCGWPHGRRARGAVRHYPEKTSAYWIWSLARVCARRAVRRDLRLRGVDVDDADAASNFSNEYDLEPVEKENILWYAWCMFNHAYASSHAFEKVDPGTREQPFCDTPLGSPLQLSAVPLSYSTMWMPRLIADYAVRPTDPEWIVLVLNRFVAQADITNVVEPQLGDLANPTYVRELQRQPLDPGEGSLRLVRA